MINASIFTEILMFSALWPAQARALQTESSQRSLCHFLQLWPDVRVLHHQMRPWFQRDTATGPMC